MSNGRLVLGNPAGSGAVRSARHAVRPTGLRFGTDTGSAPAPRRLAVEHVLDGGVVLHAGVGPHVLHGLGVVLRLVVVARQLAWRGQVAHEMAGLVATVHPRQAAAAQLDGGLL